MSVSKQADNAPTLRPPPVTDPTGMIITANFSASGFSKRWSHCHQLANYLARFASANEGDLERCATLLSTFFNELLEAIYRNHDPSSEIVINLERNADRIVVRASVPVNEQAASFYLHAADLISQSDPMAIYRERLERDASEEELTALGLLELAVVYDSKLVIEESARVDLMNLRVEFSLAEVSEV